MPLQDVAEASAVDSRRAALGEGHRGLEAFRRIIQDEYGQDPARFEQRTLRTYLPGFSFAGKQVFDIGCGWGLHSVYFALQGARVLGADPGGDGVEGPDIDAAFKRLAQATGVEDRVENRCLPFMEVDCAGRTFDLLFCHNAVNHLHEVETDLRRDQAARDEYVRIFRRMHDLLRPGGMVFLTDRSRHGLWYLPAAAGLYVRPFATPNIERKKHQRGRIWMEVMREAGFDRFELEYLVPRPLRRLAVLRRSEAVSWMTMSAFVLRAYRPDR